MFLGFSMVYFFKLQVIESEKFEEKERKQGQRRILHPGARGDVLDREGRLLIGNKAQFSAVIHLDALKSEIWKEKVALKKTAFRIREELLNLKDLNLVKLINHCLKETHLKERFILLSGKKKKGALQRVKIYWQNQRITVNENTKSEWSCTISFSNPDGLSSITTENTADLINVNVAGLFSTNFYIHPDNHLLPYKPSANQVVTQNLFTKFFTFKDGVTGNQPEFNTNSFTLGSEARFAVVNKYLKQINILTGREVKLSFVKLQNHWKRRLVLPMELIPNLTPHEYASLIEGLSPNSPVQVQVESVRHYPEKSLASHVLGYVGSGYEADAEGLVGSDLATFEIKGKKGKSGIEKFFDNHLKGKDGVDIWRINPMGLRYDQIEKTASEKGKPLQLTIDLDIQKVAENESVLTGFYLTMIGKKPLRKERKGN